MAIEPPRSASEAETLTGFLEFYRQSVVEAVGGLDRDALAYSPVASDSSPGGIVKHLAYVERWWFQDVLGGRDVEYPYTRDDPDADFRIEPGETAESLIELYERECAVAREVVASRPDLDAMYETPRNPVSLRWILVHMIEETARHAGHIDILNELYAAHTSDRP